MTFLNELNKDIVATHKSLADLNESMSMALQDSKKWNIASRFLSGTGLWSLQNRIRAVISVFGEYHRGQLKQLETQQKNAELMESLATRTETLKKARDNLNESTIINVTTLEGYIDARKGYLKDTEKEIELLNAKNVLLPAQETHLANLLTYQRLTNDAQEKAVEQLERVSPAYEEAVRLGKQYNITTGAAQQILEHRVDVMQQMADAQDKVLTGGKKQQEMQGKLEWAQMHKQQWDKGGKKAEAFEAAALAASGGKKDKAYKTEMKKLKWHQKNMWANVSMLALMDRWDKVKDFLLKVKDIAIAVGKGFLTFLKWLPFVMLAVYVIYHIFKRAWPFLQVIWEVIGGIVNQLMGFMIDGYTFLSLIGEGFSDIIAGFKSGEMGEILLGILKVAGGVLWGLIAITLSLVWIGIGLFLSGIWVTLFGFWDSAEGFGANFISALLQLTTYFIVGIAIWYSIQAWTMRAAFANAGVAAIALVIIELIRSWSFGKFAEGGTVKGGLSLVGEKGPELVNLPRGSRVHSNLNSRRMVGGNNVTVNVQGRVGASDQEVRDIARKVGLQINREINRSTASGTRM
jgi:hypothetical protein